MTFLTGLMVRSNVSPITVEEWAALPDGIKELWDWVAESKRS